MDEQIIKQSILDSLTIDVVHPLHDAILDEVCENIANSEELKKTIMLTAYQAFLTSIEVLRATLKGTIESQNADQITLNYRNQEFIIRKDDLFLKDPKNE